MFGNNFYEIFALRQQASLWLTPIQLQSFPCKHCEYNFRTSQCGYKQMKPSNISHLLALNKLQNCKIIQSVDAQIMKILNCAILRNRSK